MWSTVKDPYTRWSVVLSS